MSLMISISSKKAWQERFDSILWTVASRERFWKRTKMAASTEQHCRIAGENHHVCMQVLQCFHRLEMPELSRWLVAVSSWQLQDSFWLALFCFSDWLGFSSWLAAFFADWLEFCSLSGRMLSWLKHYMY